MNVSLPAMPPLDLLPYPLILQGLQTAHMSVTCSVPCSSQPLLHGHQLARYVASEPASLFTHPIAVANSIYVSDLQRFLWFSNLVCMGASLPIMPPLNLLSDPSILQSRCKQRSHEA